MTKKTSCNTDLLVALMITSKRTTQGFNKMHYLETEHTDGNHYRISWNGSATYNIQIPIGGQWVDIECFTCYEYDNENDAFNYAIDWMLENICEDECEDV